MMNANPTSYNHEEYSMTQSPLCKNCGFPLCHYRTKSCILYMGETQAICGSCGLAQEAKTTFDFSSPFMTHIEHQMAERLYSIATALGDKCNYNIVKKNLSMKLLNIGMKNIIVKIIKNLKSIKI